MSGEDLNTSQIQSAVRKREYKNLLEIGGQAADNVDSNSVVENLSVLKDLLIKSNELVGQGNLTDRVGQSAEVVLDAQVKFLYSSNYTQHRDMLNKIAFRCVSWPVI